MPFFLSFIHDSFDSMRVLYSSLFLCLTLFTLSACESRILNTAQDMKVELIGVDEAFCTLSTEYNRYQLYAPGTVNIERSPEPMEIDCRSDLGRRRVVTIEPEALDFYYRYPEAIAIDFSVIDYGTRYNGFRAQSTVGAPVILTEDSFVAPIATSQAYPVPRTHMMVGRRSEPIALR